MKRIAFLSILFAALIQFAIERAMFDLWILIIAIVPLLWNPGRALRITREKQLVVGSKHANEKQLKALAETEATHLESRGRSHAIQNLQDSQPGAAKNSAILNESRPQ